jgi:hypothetical protein
MLRYYKKHIFTLKEMLNELDPASSNFEHLVDIQIYILKRILHTENKISDKKEELKELKSALRTKSSSKEKSSNIKTKCLEIQKSIDGYYFLLYVWRCFGDGIAFKYLSKWNLKRLMFKSDSPDIKQSSGFIGGKKGIDNEFALLLEAKANGVPALLCDLTNTIRHGDICLLGADDPYVIEVKSSDNTNKRVKRQRESIGKIHSYLESDAGDIAGIEIMQRVNLTVEERHNNDSFNTAIDSAVLGKSCSINPEKGVHYIGYKIGSKPDYDALMSGIKEPVVFLLNEVKNKKSWGNYYPFTLSIKSADSLFAFLKGDIFLIVVLDGRVMKEMAEDIGFKLDIVQSIDVGLQFTKNVSETEEPFTAIVSEHFTGRLGFEFLSLKWFFENEKNLLNQLQEKYGV